MNYLSVCSGIESATVAWHSLGWNAVSFSEIEPFPCAVLAHHYPTVPNLGDLTQFEDWSDLHLAQADILVGGTPCQAFSVAGSRESLNDQRGNLTLTYAELLDRIDSIRIQLQRPPAICVWENVPGVLSTKDNAFGCFLGKLVGEDFPLEPPGKRWTDAGAVFGPKRAVAWRILDAQYFGLAQRRRRVFLIASAREGFNSAEVLFELEGLRRDSPPSREPGEGVAVDVRCGFEVGGTLGPRVSRLTTDECAQGAAIVAAPLIRPLQNVTGALCTQSGEATQQVAETDQLIPLCLATGQAGAEIGIGIGTTLNCNHEAPIVAIAFETRFVRNGRGAPDVVVPPLKAQSGTNGKGDGAPCVVVKPSHCNHEAPIVAFSDVADPIAANQGKTWTREGSGNFRMSNVAIEGMAVRRLTPRECERLQGFPDDYTLIPYRGKPAADGPRYKSLGNSKAVPVVRWIGRRIQQYLNQA